jgi:hypothetical protein
MTEISAQLTGLKIVMKFQPGLKNVALFLSVLFLNATTVSQKLNNRHEQHFKFFEEAE